MNFLYLLICQLDVEDSEILEVIEPQDGKQQKAICWPISWTYYVNKKLTHIMISDQDMKCLLWQFGYPTNTWAQTTSKTL